MLQSWMLLKLNIPVVFKSLIRRINVTEICKNIANGKLNASGLS